MITKYNKFIIKTNENQLELFTKNKISKDEISKKNTVYINSFDDFIHKGFGIKSIENSLSTIILIDSNFHDVEEYNAIKLEATFKVKYKKDILNVALGKPEKSPDFALNNILQQMYTSFTNIPLLELNVNKDSINEYTFKFIVSYSNLNEAIYTIEKPIENKKNINKEDNELEIYNENLINFANIGTDESGILIGNCKICNMNGINIYNHIKTEDHLNNVNEGIGNKLKKFSIGLAIIASMASCSKPDASDMPKPVSKADTTHITPTPIDTVHVTPKDTTKIIPINKSINGIWYPSDQCRKDQWEHFVISDNYFDWFSKGFAPSGKFDTVSYRMYNISLLKITDPKNPLYLNINDEMTERLFEIKDKKLIEYWRTPGTREYTLAKSGAYDLTFGLYVDDLGRLIFDGHWVYERHLKENTIFENKNEIYNENINFSDFTNIGYDEDGTVIGNCKICNSNGIDIYEHVKTIEHINNKKTSIEEFNGFNTAYRWISLFGGDNLLSNKNIHNGIFLSKSLLDGSLTIKEIDNAITNNVPFSETPLYKNVIKQYLEKNTINEDMGPSMGALAFKPSFDERATKLKYLAIKNVISSNFNKDLPFLVKTGTTMTQPARYYLIDVRFKESGEDKLLYLDFYNDNGVESNAPFSDNKNKITFVYDMIKDSYIDSSTSYKLNSYGVNFLIKAANLIKQMYYTKYPERHNTGNYDINVEKTEQLKKSKLTKDHFLRYAE